MILKSIFLFIFTFLSIPCIAQEYAVNSGDVITISVLGQQSLSGMVTVDPSGYITLPPPVGTLRVAGKTPSEIGVLLEERLKRYVKEPIVFISVKPLEGFSVHIIGEVRSPNSYTVPEGTSLQELITRAGGLTDLADKKNVRLFRKEADSDREELVKEERVDYSLFTEDYDITANPILKPNDMVLIPGLSREERAAQTVGVFGAVTSPGVHTLLYPLPLIEVLTLAGGTANNADLSRVSILKSRGADSDPDGQGGEYVWSYIALEDFFSGSDQNANPLVSPGTIVYVSTIELEEKDKFSVNVVGQVEKAGVYPVTEGARLFDAVYMAGGFSDEAAIDRVTVIRSVQQGSSMFQVDVGGYLKTGDMKGNPILIEGDTVFVPMVEGAKRVSSIHTPFFESIRLSIMGQVNSPSDYQVSADSNLLDVLRLAGGPASDADLKRVIIIREKAGGERRLKVDLNYILEEGELDLLPQLLTGDTIFVPKIRPKLNIWGRIVRAAVDVSTIVIAYLLITGQRFYR